MELSSRWDFTDVSFLSLAFWAGGRCCRAVGVQWGRWFAVMRNEI